MLWIYFIKNSTSDCATREIKTDDSTNAERWYSKTDMRYHTSSSLWILFYMSKEWVEYIFEKSFQWNTNKKYGENAGNTADMYPDLETDTKNIH